MQLSADPPLTPITPFLQTVALSQNNRAVATARWHVAPDAPDGVVQLLDFTVVPVRRRQGLGKQLLAALVEQCHAYHRARQVPLRRVWISLRQKQHVIARAFFMSQGFTHIATIKDLLKDEDALIYIRTFD
jgi:ribosomal protein S18 acetylase RimI-like enzyme